MGLTLSAPPPSPPSFPSRFSHLQQTIGRSNFPSIQPHKPRGYCDNRFTGLSSILVRKNFHWSQVKRAHRNVNKGLVGTGGNSTPPPQHTLLLFFPPILLLHIATAEYPDTVCLPVQLEMR
ncbi:hypothetical protein HNY73_012205 [Argiope bruennichi]|uniref:Uncharacterized protein n=1 Tax=Argiope bruennichi TaxID=94029 RepID=A0A8T0EVT6_ARGBR|nr:hypothetical protein HNY73_012205 [Argiope bruennichi]